MADRGSLRLAFVVCLGVVVSMSVADVEELGPQELGDGSEIGETPADPITAVHTVPLPHSCVACRSASSLEDPFGAAERGELVHQEA